MQRFENLLKKHPLIAILRGITPDNVLDIVGILVEEGIRLVEVPMNSPDPFKSIELIARTFGNELITGAGTVVNVNDVARVRDAGGLLVVSPVCDPSVIERSLQLGLLPLPGVATPTEAFNAYASGARWLKVFPAETLGTSAIKAWRSVLPSDAGLIPVGGVTPDNIARFRAAGAVGFGIGSAIYSSGDMSDDVRIRARSFIKAVSSMN